MRITEILQVLSESTRLRMLRLLAQEELSVAELQEILEMGQSRISSHLGLLRRHDMVSDRKDGKKTFYNLNPDVAERSDLIRFALAEESEEEFWETDRSALSRIIDRRRRASEKYFDEVAVRLGKNYVPGRSWDAIGHFLLRLVPNITIADLGAGEGMISQLLAERAKKVFCIDSSKSMVRIGKELSKKNKLSNLTYKHGDIEKVPLPASSVDLALMSQSLHHARRPDTALTEAFRILKQNGQLIVLDLKKHQFEKARELYGDQWLGFAENQLYRMVKEAGFRKVKVQTVAKEAIEPYFETILACGEKLS
ncbi:MAG: transcriptional regulator [Opitutae bacterium]|mgnify:FL=1|nr:transcriptional regulator [Opitutae bacterium]|tara:strand:- start:7070 stop:7999 length:930 start_codon:yes stop_codon:yes gene_type:complete